MEQYHRKLSEADIERIVKRDFSADAHGAIHDLISGVAVREKARVILACLKNAAGSFEKLKGELANAEGWWREIISEAEYPHYTKKMFRIERLPEDEKQRIIEKDKNQYLAWLQRGPANDKRGEA